MKERGILFSAPMVRALLAGTKTQTRRVVKWQGPKGFPHYFDRAFIDSPAGVRRLCVPYHHPNDPDMGDGNPAHRHYPPQGDPGDRLWVRETWRPIASSYQHWTSVLYAADEAMLDRPYFEAKLGRQKWVPSIHMPRVASRITLEITAVRVERLQDISEADAIAEGRSLTPGDPRGYFPDTWQAINGPGSWDANPWVWVIEFRKV